MREFDKTLKRPDFWVKREEVYKSEKMKPLEKKIDKFLAENNVKYHRCFPVRLGSKHNKDRFYGLCSFYLPDQKMILDVPTGIEDEHTYDNTRPIYILHHGITAESMFPIDEDCPWRDVKTQLKILLGI